jgi:hypothetical protein
MCGAQAVDNRQRIRKPYPKPSTKVARAFKNVVREMKGKCFALGGTDKYAEHDLTWHTRRVISGFAGEKRRLYEEGFEKILLWDASHGVDGVRVGFPEKRNDTPVAYVGLFVKDEPDDVLKNLLSKGFARRSRGICPSVVMFPDSQQEYLSLIAIEGAAFGSMVAGKKRLVNYLADFVPDTSGGSVPMFTAGLTLEDVAWCMRTAAGLGLHWFKFDASSFDGSQHFCAEVARVIGWSMAQQWFGNDRLWPWMEKIAEIQRDIYLYMKGGLRATHKQIRLSGTYLTSTDNQIVYVSLLFAAADFLNLPRPFVICAGDDTIAGFESVWFNKMSCPDLEEEGQSGTLLNGIDWAMRFMKECGVETEIEQMTDDMEEIVFCRMKLVTKADGVETLAKHPARVLDKLATVYRLTGNRLDDRALSLMYETCVGYNGLWGGVPVVGVMARVFGRLYRSMICNLDSSAREQVKRDNYILANLGPEAWTLDEVDYPMESRISLERSYGISIDVQIRIETLLKSEAFQSAVTQSLQTKQNWIPVSYRGI